LSGNSLENINIKEPKTHFQFDNGINKIKQKRGSLELPLFCLYEQY